jgi:hypothetical protein
MSGELDTLRGVRPVLRGDHGNLSLKNGKAPGSYPTIRVVLVRVKSMQYLLI